MRAEELVVHQLRNLYGLKDEDIKVQWGGIVLGPWKAQYTH